MLFTPRAITMRQTTVDRSLEIKKIESSPSKKDPTRADTSGNKNLNGQSSASSKDIVAKVGTFRPVAETERFKSTSKGGIGLLNISNLETKVNSGGDNTPLSGSALTAQVPKQSRAVESGKSESLTSMIPSENHSAGARLGELQSGPPASLPNTQYLAGLNQRRFVSKKSVSNNYSIPSSSDRAAASKSLAISNVEATDLKNYKSSKGNDNSFVSFPLGNKLKHKDRLLVKRSQVSSSSTQLPTKLPEAVHLPKVPCGRISNEQLRNVHVPSIPSKLRYFRHSEDVQYNLSMSIVGALGK